MNIVRLPVQLFLVAVALAGIWIGYVIAFCFFMPDVYSGSVQSALFVAASAPAILGGLIGVFVILRRRILTFGIVVSIVAGAVAFWNLMVLWPVA